MRFSITATLLAVATLMGCGGEPGSRTGAPLRVVVSITPLAGIVRPLADAVGGEVEVLAPPGVSPHGFELTPDDLRRLGRADVVVLVGLGFEPQVERALAAHPSASRVVVRLSDSPHAGPHEDDAHSDAHRHGDAHLWLDPQVVADTVAPLHEAIRTRGEARGELTAEREDALNRAGAALFDDVLALDAEYAARLAPFHGRAIVTHHAAWTRVGVRYGLRVAAVLRPIESSEPTPGEVSAAIDAIRAERIRVIFAEPQYAGTAAERIANATGAGLAVLDPLGHGDWFAMMRGNLDTLVRALEQE